MGQELRDPWVAVDATVRKNAKIVSLPSDTARWGWIAGVLGEAKLQRPQGRFVSREHLLEAVGRFGRYVPDYLRAGLLEQAPALCSWCRPRWPDVRDGELVIHQWAKHQRDPGAAERAQTWRDERAQNAPRTPPERAANAGRTNRVRVTNEAGAFAPARTPARAATATATVERSQVPSAVPRRTRDGTRPKKVEGFSTVGEVDWHHTLDQRQLEAWGSFELPLVERVVPVYPPAGTASDGPDAESPSQRAMLWSVLDACPEALPRWIAEAPKGATASGVIGHVLECWHARRDEEAERAAYDEVRWSGAKQAEAEGAPAWVAALDAMPR